MKIKKEILFRSNEHDESASIELVSLELSDVTIGNIKKAQEIIKNNPFPIDNISLRLNDGDDYSYIDFDGSVTDEWHDDGGNLLVYESAVYFYAQGKYDSSSQIETEELGLNN